MHDDILIVGGGFSGMACAAALSARGFKVLVVESHQTHDPRFRGELIHPRGVRWLDSLGLKDAVLSSGAVPVTGFAVTSPGLRPALLPYAERWGEGLGVDHHQMVAALRAEVRTRAGVTLRQGEPVAEVLKEGGRVVGVKLRNGEELRARLVIGADGRQSRVRAALGLEADVRLLSYTVVATVEGALLPWKSHGHVFLGAPGPVLAYPYADGRIRLCIDVPTTAPKGKAAMVQWIEEHSLPHVPEPLRSAVREALHANPFEACATHSVYTQECTVPGAVLLGDSGGCSHPLTATGMTAAMSDVVTLAEELRARGLTDAACLAYQRRRYRFARAREIFTEALYDVFRATDSGSEGLRAGIFEYWRQSRGARERSMGILAGEDSRKRTFVTEYARVTGRSALRTWRHPSRTAAVLETSLNRLRRSVRRFLPLRATAAAAP